MRSIILFTFALIIGGCPDDDPLAPAATDPYACDESVDFALFQPLVSPVYDPEKGGLLIPAGDSFVVHTTQLATKADQMDLFFQLVGGISAQLAETDGLIAVSLAGSQACGFSRTLAIWQDEASMYTFVGKGAHAEAMARTLEVSTSGRVTHWTATLEEINALTWDVAKQRLAKVEASAVYR